MVIQSIKIIGFGKLQNVSHKFSEGINVIYGKNEAGKSTTHSFIKAMLFGMNSRKSRSRLNNLTKYEPWENNNKYEGYLTFTYKNNTYTIHRDFSDINPIFTIKNDVTGLYLKNPDLFLNECLCNLTETSFNNTISISQLKSATEQGMITELHKYIANLNTSGDMSINSIAAIEYLKKQKENFEEQKIPDATMLYTKNLGSIRKIEKDLSSPLYKNMIPDLQSKKDLDQRKIKENLDKISKIEQDSENRTLELKQNGFETKNDIDTLKVETEKIYMEYELLNNLGKKATRIVLDILMMVLGIFIGIVNTIVLTICYPGLATMAGFNNLGKMLPSIVDFLNNLPFTPAPIIGFLYALALILVITGFVLLISNTQTKGKLDDMNAVLSEILNHQINTPVVSETNIKNFKQHISRMYNLLDRIDSNKELIQEIKKENNELTDKQDDYVKKMQEQQRLQYEIEQKVSSINQLKIESDKLKKDIETNDDLDKEIESLTLSIETISAIANKVKTMFGTYLNQTSSRYVAGLTRGIYNSINVDDSLNITINTMDRIVPLEQLSGGAMDQMYLAIRLATTDLIQGQSENLPLLFDDCFAMYDNERLEYALSYLSNNYKRQMIIFTCHTRERDILKEDDIEYNYIEI